MRFFKAALVILSFVMLPISLARAAPLPPLPEVTEAEGRLGTCFSYYDDDAGNPRAPQAYAAGSRGDRFDFRWDVIESSHGDFSFAGHHNVVDIDHANELDTVGILWATPDWAACSQVARWRALAAPQPPGNPHGRNRAPDPGSRIPCNLNLAWDDPQNYWGQYVYQVVSEFKDKVHIWELWNEPDRPGFWAGDEAQYAQLLKVGYQAVKAADPAATVLFGGTAYWGNEGFHKVVLDHLLATDPATLENNGYFDVMSLHLYSGAYHNHNISAKVKREVDERVGPHPLWLTETGVPIWDEKVGDPAHYEASAEEAAAYVIQAFAGARAADVDRFFFFRLHDADMIYGDQFFGLTRNDATIRPAYLAYQVAARYLRGENQITGPFVTPQGIERITFLGTPYGRIDVLWNTLEEHTTSYAHPAILPTATLVTHRGVTQTLTPSAGSFDLELAPATANLHPDGVYFIGGPPVLLLQTDTVAPTSELRSLSPIDAHNQLTLTWEAMDDLAGYWHEEIQLAPTPEGPWATIAGLSQTDNVTQTTITLPPPSTYYQPWYFRARARDRVGNWEPWPEEAELSTETITRTVRLEAVAYSDQPSTFRYPLPGVAMTWEAPNGAAISQTLGASTIYSESLMLPVGLPWVVTRTVPAGVHHLTMSHPEHLRAHLPLHVHPGAGVQQITVSHELSFRRARLFLPLVARTS